MRIEEMLGIDLSNPKDQHARLLVEEDSKMLDELIAHARRQNLSQSEIARRMGVSASSVSRIESGERDPHLSTLRRYAFAIGAVIRHEVRPFQSGSRTYAARAQDPASEGASRWDASSDARPPSVAASPRHGVKTARR